jgi:hypothetical protein
LIEFARKNMYTEVNNNLSNYLESNKNRMWELIQNWTNFYGVRELEMCPKESESDSAGKKTKMKKVPANSTLWFSTSPLKTIKDYKLKSQSSKNE